MTIAGRSFTVLQGGTAALAVADSRVCRIETLAGNGDAAYYGDEVINSATVAFNNISGALSSFARAAGIEVQAIVPISALKGDNVVEATPGWAGYNGPSLLQVLEQLDVTACEAGEAFAFPVQWVEKFSSSLAERCSRMARTR